jgi:hypothetical protein
VEEISFLQLEVGAKDGRKSCKTQKNSISGSYNEQQDPCTDRYLLPSTYAKVAKATIKLKLDIHDL